MVEREAWEVGATPYLGFFTSSLVCVVLLLLAVFIWGVLWSLLSQGRGSRRIRRCGRRRGLGSWRGFGSWLLQLLVVFEIFGFEFLSSCVLGIVIFCGFVVNYNHRLGASFGDR